MMQCDEVQSALKRFGDIEHVSECIRACRTHIGWVGRVVRVRMKAQRVGGSKGMYCEVIMLICELAARVNLSTVLYVVVCNGSVM
jgi:hypothetical protein